MLKEEKYSAELRKQWNILPKECQKLRCFTYLNLYAEGW